MIEANTIIYLSDLLTNRSQDVIKSPNEYNLLATNFISLTIQNKVFSNIISIHNSIDLRSSCKQPRVDVEIKLIEEITIVFSSYNCLVRKDSNCS